MLAKEIKNKFVVPEMHDKCGVIAASKDEKNSFWYHVHENEKVPDEKEFDLAIHLKLEDVNEPMGAGIPIDVMTGNQEDINCLFKELNVLLVAEVNREKVFPGLTEFLEKLKEKVKE